MNWNRIYVGFRPSLLWGLGSGHFGCFLADLKMESSLDCIFVW